MPYIMSNTTNADVQRGFDQQAVMSGISGLQSGISGLSTQLCNSTGDIQQSLCSGFAGVNATVNSGFANAETAATARQMANMNQAFNAQTAMLQGFNNIGSQFADCCCENRLLTTQRGYEAQIRTLEQTNQLGSQADRNTRTLADQIAAQTVAMNDGFCQIKERELQGKIDSLLAENTSLKTALSEGRQTQQFTAAFNILDNKITELAAKQPNTIPVQWPNVQAVNTTPYMGGFNPYGYGWGGQSYWG